VSWIQTHLHLPLTPLELALQPLSQGLAEALSQLFILFRTLSCRAGPGRRNRRGRGLI
jgi:hypothetical protein